MKQENQVLVVLGAGRSGTSLVMHLLKAMGANVSSKAVSPRYHNPMGPMEDVELAQIFDDIILPACCMNRLVPFPTSNNYINTDELNRGLRKVSNIIHSKVNKSSDERPWAVKDPVLSYFADKLLPIFNDLEMNPKFILCVRNPASVIASRKKNFNTNPEMSILAWLTSNVSALCATGGDCFIIHYEDLISERNEQVVTELGNFAGLGEKYLSKALSMIDPKLNRQGFASDNYKINFVAKDFYSILKQCKTNNYDKSLLFEAVSKCKKNIVAFQGWLDYVYKSEKLKHQLANANKNIKSISDSGIKFTTESSLSTQRSSEELSEAIAEFRRVNLI